MTNGPARGKLAFASLLVRGLTFGDRARAARIAWRLALIAAVALPCALRANAVDLSPTDSGVSGVVPYLVDDVVAVRGDIDLLRKEMAGSNPSSQLAQDIASRETLIDLMQNQCVRAFELESRMPVPYGWPGPWPANTCMDSRFPTGYMKLLKASACDDAGKFRMPLAPGRYALLVGNSPIYHAFEGKKIAKTNHWWEVIEIRPHQWRMTEPAPLGAMSPRQPPIIKAWYDSGVRGRVGPPPSKNPRAILGGPIRSDSPLQAQCVEAFPAGSPYLTACAECRFSDGAFRLPLPPGRYTLDFFLLGQSLDKPENHRLANVEVRSAQWINLYELGAVADPMAPNGTAPLSAKSIGAAWILRVVPASLTFSTVSSPTGNKIVIRVLTVANVGDGILSGVVGAPDVPFSIARGGGPFVLDPQTRFSVLVGFAPGSSGNFRDRLTITSSDPADPSVTVSVVGNAR